MRVKIIFQSSPKSIPSFHTPNFTLRLDKHTERRYNGLANGVWRSLVSRLVRVQEARGSNPLTPTNNVGIAFAVPTFLIGHIGDSNNQMQLSSGQLLADGWTAATP